MFSPRIAHRIHRVVKGKSLHLFTVVVVVVVVGCASSIYYATTAVTIFSQQGLRTHLLLCRITSSRKNSIQFCQCACVYESVSVELKNLQKKEYIRKPRCDRMCSNISLGACVFCV